MAAAEKSLPMGIEDKPPAIIKDNGQDQDSQHFGKRRGQIPAGIHFIANAEQTIIQLNELLSQQGFCAKNLDDTDAPEGLIQYGQTLTLPGSRNFTLAFHGSADTGD